MKTTIHPKQNDKSDPTREDYMRIAKETEAESYVRDLESRPEGRETLLVDTDIACRFLRVTPYILKKRMRECSMVSVSKGRKNLYWFADLLKIKEAYGE